MVLGTTCNVHAVGSMYDRVQFVLYIYTVYILYILVLLYPVQ
jgi:hypothetical protein